MTPSMDTNSMTMTRPILASSVVFARNEREAVEGTAVADAGYSGLRSTSRHEWNWGRLVKLSASATHEQSFAERSAGCDGAGGTEPAPLAAQKRALVDPRCDATRRARGKPKSQTEIAADLIASASSSAIAFAGKESSEADDPHDHSVAKAIAGCNVAPQRMRSSARPTADARMQPRRPRWTRWWMTPIWVTPPRWPLSLRTR